MENYAKIINNGAGIEMAPACPVLNGRRYIGAVPPAVYAALGFYPLAPEEAPGAGYHPAGYMLQEGVICRIWATDEQTAEPEPGEDNGPSLEEARAEVQARTEAIFALPQKVAELEGIVADQDAALMELAELLAGGDDNG